MSKEWPDVPALVEEARQASVRPALWEPYRLYNALADALETMHDLYLQESGTVSVLTGQLDDALHKKEEGKMGDEEEQIQGYMSLTGDFGDEVPADFVMWNETGSEILFRLAMEMVPENRYQLLVRYAGETSDD